MNLFEKTYNQIKDLDKPEFATEYWKGKSDILANEFCTAFPKDFLQNHHIKETMVAANEMTAMVQLGYIKKYWGDKANELLEEPDVGGLARPVNLEKHSCNIINHVNFATKFVENHTGNDPKVILEIGGGFGTLGMVFKKIYPDITYIVLDVPVISALQKCYLGDISDIHAPEESVLLFLNKDKINLMPIGCLDYYKNFHKIAPDTLIAMWSIGEVSPTMNDWVLSVDTPNFMVGTHNWKCGAFTQASRVYNHFKEKSTYTEEVGPNNHLLIK